MKKILLFIIILSVVLFVYRTKSVKFLNTIFAQENEDKSEDNGADTKKEIKTDLDDLKYEFSNDEIKAFLLQYERAKKIRLKLKNVQDDIETINSDIRKVNSKLAMFNKLQMKLKKKFANKLQVDKDNTAILVKTYESMKPNEAAALILKHKLKIILRLMEDIKPAKMAKIYTEMLRLDLNRSVAIAERFTGFNSRYTKELYKQEITEDEISLDSDDEEKS